MSCTLESHALTVTVELPTAVLTVLVTVDVEPGEEAIRYYNGFDGAGYPGSSPTVADVESVEFIECVTDSGDYFTREECGVCTDTLDRLARAAVESGDYDDTILESACL